MIRLTTTNDSQPQPVLVNPAQILSVDTFGKLVRVNLPGITYYVTESLDEVDGLLARQHSIRDVVSALNDIASRISHAAGKDY